jgi:hypothetical protein
LWIAGLSEGAPYLPADHQELHGTSLTAPIVFVDAGFRSGPHGLGWLDVTVDHHAVMCSPRRR